MISPLREAVINMLKKKFLSEKTSVFLVDGNTVHSIKTNLSEGDESNRLFSSSNAVALGAAIVARYSNMQKSIKRLGTRNDRIENKLKKKYKEENQRNKLLMNNFLYKVRKALDGFEEAIAAVPNANAKSEDAKSELLSKYEELCKALNDRNQNNDLRSD